MTNAEIYGINEALGKAFNNEERYLPAKINFHIQKNKNILAQSTEAIMAVRQQIIEQYGTIDKDKGTFSINDANIQIANKELEDLLNEKQELNISKISINDLETLEFTPKQMQALLFMIEED